MPSQCVIRETCLLELYVGALLLCFRLPADTKKGVVNAVCFTARPVAHRKRIDFGGFLTSSVLSAMTRRASAVTFTSASAFVFPYAITPGSEEISASHRPSVSCSNSISKDSASGGCGTVAMTKLSKPDGGEKPCRGRIMVVQSCCVKLNRAGPRAQVAITVPAHTVLQDSRCDLSDPPPSQASRAASDVCGRNCNTRSAGRTRPSDCPAFLRRHWSAA